MRPDDETREPDEHEEGAPAEPGDGADAGEHEAPPPRHLGRAPSAPSSAEGRGRSGRRGEARRRRARRRLHRGVRRDRARPRRGARRTGRARDRRRARGRRRARRGSSSTRPSRTPTELDDEDLDAGRRRARGRRARGDDDGHDGEELAEEPDSAAARGALARDGRGRDACARRHGGGQGGGARRAARPGGEEAGRAGAAAPPRPRPRSSRSRVVAATAAEPAEEEPRTGKTPRAKRLWARFLAASLVIVVSIAAATSISLLVYLTDIADGPLRQRRARRPASRPHRGRRRRPADDPDPRLRQAPRHQGRPGPLGHDDAAAGRPRQGPDRAALDPARPPGQHPGRRGRQVQRRLLLRRAREDAEGGQAADRARRSTTSSTSTSPASPTPSTRSAASTSTSTVATTSPRTTETSEIDIEAGYQRLCGYKALAVRALPPLRQRPRPRRAPAGLPARGAPEAAARRS